MSMMSGIRVRKNRAANASDRCSSSIFLPRLQLRRHTSLTRSGRCMPSPTRTFGQQPSLGRGIVLRLRMRSCRPSSTSGSRSRPGNSRCRPVEQNPRRWRAGCRLSFPASRCPSPCAASPCCPRSAPSCTMALSPAPAPCPFPGAAQQGIAHQAKRFVGCAEGELRPDREAELPLGHPRAASGGQVLCRRRRSVAGHQFGGSRDRSGSGTSRASPARPAHRFRRPPARARPRGALQQRSAIGSGTRGRSAWLSWNLREGTGRP